ncbi:MAG: glycosyltransferase 87 family protein [Lachnospiraceae bacterium]|nr:glycosyltransferase 87 family protein [Lachnospiraceae bacterium]
MQLLRRLKDNRIIRTALIAVLAIVAAVSVFQGIRNAIELSQDFQWDAAKALADGIDPYELSESPEKAMEYPDLAEFYKMFTDRGLNQQMEANQFPSLLMLLFPMTVFPPYAAKVVWLVLNLAFTAGIALLLKKTFFEQTGTYEYCLIVLLTLAGTPYRNQLGVGQHTLFAFFFFMLAVFFEKRSQDKTGIGSTCLIALCLFVSYFKYTLTAPLTLWFLYKRRYKEIAISIALHVVLTVAAAAMLKKSVVYMITAPLHVASRLSAEGGLDLGVLIGGKAYYAAALIFALMLTAIVMMLPEDKEKLLFSALILWSLILTYHRTYDFFVLSAVTMLFCKDEDTGITETYRPHLTASYAILITAVYFVLRIFSENTASKAVTGTLYYAFTVAVTLLLVKAVTDKRGKTNGQT